MANDIDLGKISITPKGDWNNKTEVEYNDIWRIKMPNIWLYKIQPV